jgi:hypothetical protein
MMGRLEKVMQRMMEVNQVDTEVRDAFLRILYELRGRGWELFHLVGWQSPLQDNSPRRAYHIEFMLPDIEEPTCHRVLAEMAVHIIEEGRSPGRVGTVAVRYAEDWEDWTLSQPIELAKDDKAGPARLVMLETPMKQGRSAVLEAIWSEVAAFSNFAQDVSDRDLKYRFGRTWDRLDAEGAVLVGIQVEKVRRWLEPSSRKRTAPTIRIPLLTRAKVQSQGGKEAGLQSQTISAEYPSADGYSIPAVLLVTLTKDKVPTKIKHICTLYHGEWPITHHYRTALPPPTLAGLERLVRHAE